MAARSLQDQGFWTPSSILAKTRSNGHEHVLRADALRMLPQQLLAGLSLELERFMSHDKDRHVAKGQEDAWGCSTISTATAPASHFNSSARPRRISYPISPGRCPHNVGHRSDINRYSELHAAMAKELVPVSCLTEKDLAVLLHAEAELQHHRYEMMDWKPTAGLQSCVMPKQLQRLHDNNTGMFTPPSHYI